MSTDIYQYPYGAPDLPETPAETERRVRLEWQINQDQDQHAKDECSFSRIVDGRLEPCAWDDLTDDEQRACIANLFRLYDF